MEDARCIASYFVADPEQRRQLEDAIFDHIAKAYRDGLDDGLAEAREINDKIMKAGSLS
jgi:hypothetical protein